MEFAIFKHTPDELAESMTGTVHDTLNFLNHNGYMSNEDHEQLIKSLAVYALPNRQGFGRKLLDRFFGKDTEETAWVFPIIIIDQAYINKPTIKKEKPSLNVVSIKKEDN